MKASMICPGKFGPWKIEAYDLRLREQSNRLTMLRRRYGPTLF